MTDRGATLCTPFIEQLPITGASISVFDDAGRQSTICASNATAARLDELQFELGEGPQWEALRTGSPVFAEDLGMRPLDDAPAFGAAVLSLNVGALFAFPMALGAVTVGIVGLYRSTAGMLDPESVDIAKRLTDLVTIRAVHRALRSAADESSESGGPSTPAMRREVHQATGMILVQLDLSATEAFMRLRGHAFATGRSVQDVAHDVVTRQLDFHDLP